MKGADRWAMGALLTVAALVVAMIAQTLTPGYRADQARLSMYAACTAAHLDHCNAVADSAASEAR